MPETPRVEIIILNYNGKELLEKYLSSVIDLEYENYGLTIVDNNSTDGSVKYLRSNYDNINIIENENNVGFSKGNNIGARATENTDYYWFLNSDVRVTKNSLTQLVNHIENVKEVGAVCPRVNNMNSPETIQSMGYDYNIFGMPSAREKGEKTPKQTEPHSVAYPSGAALLIDKDVWDEIEGFDSENFIYGDDTYLGLNTWLHGYRVYVVPSSLIYHEEGGSQNSEIAPFVAYHNARSRTRTYLKLLERSSLLIGVGGFVIHSLYQILTDIFHQRSSDLAKERFKGYMSPLFDYKEIMRERKDIKEERELDDLKYISII